MEQILSGTFRNDGRGRREHGERCSGRAASSERSTRWPGLTSALGEASPPGDRRAVSRRTNNTQTSAALLSPAQERRPEPTRHQRRHRPHGQALKPVSRPAPSCPLFLWTPKDGGAADCPAAATSMGGRSLRRLGQVPFDGAGAGGAWRPAPHRCEGPTRDLLARPHFRPWGPSQPAVLRSLCTSPHLCPLGRGLDFCIRPGGKYLGTVGSARPVSVAQLLHRSAKAAPDGTHARGHGRVPVGLPLRNQTVVWAGFL